MGVPRYYDDPDVIDMMVDLYVADCVDKKLPLTVPGLALFLGFCDKRSIYDYRDNEKFTHSIRRALTIIENGYVTHVAKGVNVAGPTFLLKAVYNYKDTQTIEMAPLILNINGKDADL